MSALTALEATDGDGGDWLDVAEFTRRSGGDATEFWRRAMFGAAIGNLDDHLRNHGFLRIGNAWRPAPAFDMNPEPYDDGTADTHQMTLFGDAEVTISKLLTKDALALFGVTERYADQWLATLRSALSQAIPRAAMRCIDQSSINMMEKRFDEAAKSLR